MFPWELPRLFLLFSPLVLIWRYSAVTKQNGVCYNAICCPVFSSCSSLWVTALRCSFRSTCCLLFYYFNRLWRLPLNPAVHSSAAGDVVKEWNKSARPVFHLVATVRNAAGSEDRFSYIIARSCFNVQRVTFHVEYSRSVTLVKVLKVSVVLLHTKRGKWQLVACPVVVDACLLHIMHFLACLQIGTE